MKGLPFQMIVGYGLLSTLWAKLDFGKKCIILPPAEVNKEPIVVESLFIQKEEGAWMQSVNCCDVSYPEIVPIELEDGTLVYPGAEANDVVEPEAEWSSSEREVGVPVYPEEMDEDHEFENFEHLALPEVRNVEFNNFLVSWKEKFKDSPGVAKGIEVKVYVDPSQPPIKEKPIRLSHAERVLAQEEVNRLLKEGVIEPSSSFWRANAFFVSKKTGGKRLVVNLKVS